MAGAEEWSPPRLVAPHAPAPVVVGEMAEVRRGWRRERRQRRLRRLWPALVVLLLMVTATAGFLLHLVLRF